MFPRPHKKYANLTCKILTGTIWTNKLKKRLKLTDDNNCPFCKHNSVNVLEDSNHVMGTCPNTIQRRNEAFAEILKLADKYTLNTTLIRPWFDSSTFKINTFDTPYALGNKGLTPKLFRYRIHLNNPKINKKI